jgi:hypothetical protein
MHRTLATCAIALFAGPLLGCMPGMDDRPRISIEFGMYPEMFEGLDVQIDGRVVGQLKKTGQHTRCSFPADPGLHEIYVDHPEIECVPARAELQGPGHKVRFLLDLEDRAADDGSLGSVIVFR